jgi:hypothetical protein
MERVAHHTQIAVDAGRSQALCEGHILVVKQIQRPDTDPRRR